MPKRILMVVTSRDKLGDTSTPTGLWLEELASAYYVFIDQGHDVVIASPAGGKAPIDPASLSEPWLTENGKRFLADASAMAKVEASRKIDSLASRDFDAVYCVGGVGAAWDFPDNPELCRIVQDLQLRKGSVVAGVCHGVLGLTSARRDGASILRGKRVTGVSNAEEKAVGFFDIVPVLPEERLKILGGDYRAADPFAENVMADGNILTGQNPASAGPLAHAVLACWREGTT